MGCIPSCPAGEVAVELDPPENWKQCKKCEVDNCSICSTVKTCLSCENGYYIQPTVSPLKNSCVESCNSDQFVNVATQTCEKCSIRFGEDCLSCSQTRCNNCTDGNNIWPDQSCKPDCPYNFDT